MQMCVCQMQGLSARPTEVRLEESCKKRRCHSSVHVSVGQCLEQTVFVNCAFCQELAALLGKQVRGKLLCMRLKSLFLQLK